MGCGAISNFQNLGLKGNKIVDVWNIGEAILRSGKKDNWSLVDVKEYDILMQFNSTVKLLRDVLSRKVYEYCIEKLQNLFVLRIHDGREFSDFSNKVCREIFSRPRNLTLVNRLREIQYKLHGAIYTREHLFRFGFVVDTLC